MLAYHSLLFGQVLHLALSCLWWAPVATLPCVTLDAAHHEKRFVQAWQAANHGRLPSSPVKPIPGPYPTSHGTIHELPGMKSGKPHSASIWYPSEATREANGTSPMFPFLVFAHGADEGSVLPSPEHE
jgi:hypothetical protein